MIPLAKIGRTPSNYGLLMKTFTDRLSFALETELYALSLKPAPECERLKEAIVLCKKALCILKKFLAGYFFESLNDEVVFFKHIKPSFYSKYIYYISVYNFHINRPTGGDEILKDYISSQLAYLKYFFDRNQTFYQYYRAGANHLDTFYFSRGNFDMYAEIEDFQGDEFFSTSHDYKISKIKANEQFQDFLHLKCRELNEDCTFKAEPPVIWTGNQTDLVELLYALVESGSFNNGNVQIKNVILYFQTIFHIDLNHYYHKYRDIANRKKERTAFLDRLKICLIKKMDDKYELEKPDLKRIHFSSLK